MGDEIPGARTDSDSHDEPGLFARFPAIPEAEIDAILMEARREADLFGLTREEEEQFAERFATAIVRQRSGHPDVLSRRVSSTGGYSNPTL